MASQRSHTPESDPSTNSTSRQQLLLAGETIHMIEDPLRRRLMDHKERMEVMFWQESAHYRTTDYLALPDTLPGLSFGDDSDGVMSEQWRTRMCEWAYQLVDHFDFPRHIVGTCMNFLDRYLAVYFSTGPMVGLPRINKRQFQLVTMCCLYLAMKLRGPHSRIPIAYMVQLSRGTVNEQDMIAMEVELLGKLTWLVNPPTAFDFLKHYLQLLMPADALNSQTDAVSARSPRLTALEDLASFLVELSVLDYYFVNVRPSTVALAALFNAMDDDPRLAASVTNPFMQHSHYHGFESLILTGEEEAVHMARQRLASLYGNAGGMNDDTLTDPGTPASARIDQEDKGNARITSPVSVTATGVHSFQS